MFWGQIRIDHVLVLFLGGIQGSEEVAGTIKIAFAGDT